MQIPPRLDGRCFYWAAVVLLFVSAAWRLYPTYTIFSQTYDEPMHLACGMEWVDKGTYTYELLHPPLARILIALGPYLDGARSHSIPSMQHEGNAILHSGNGYWRNLMLARLGNLPFVALACGVVYLWASRWFSRVAALWAVLLFVNLPPILGHAGLATLDLASAATFPLSLFLLLAWLEAPGGRSAAWMGLGMGLAFSSKFSSFVFLPACLAVAAVFLLATGQGRWRMSRRQVVQAFFGVGVALLVTWACYRFTLKPYSTSSTEHPFADGLLGGVPLLRDLVAEGSEVPLPLTPVARGLLAVRNINRAGHDGYLFGEYRRYGFWHFFPVVLAVKTPLPFFALALAGALACLWNFRSAPWQRTVTVLFPFVILAVASTSRINLGVRHILAVYPLLAVAAGHAVSVMSSGRRRMWIRALPVFLVALAAADSIAAHPDYLAYFNQLAGSEPGRILSESDLDWGQDVGRLSKRLRELGVERVSVKLFGTAALDKAGLPPHHEIARDERVTGFVAVSAHYIYLDCAATGSYCWLRALTPLEKIGKSIYLYKIPE